MKIAGFIKSSLIDYPGNIAAVIFTQGCNFRCGFCHNPDLIPLKGEYIDENEIFDYLKEKKNILDGVVITGGEPTIQVDLKQFILKLKKLGFLVKLDTNGTNPTLLKELINEKLIDYVAMDVKSNLENYYKITESKNIKSVEESIGILLNKSIDYEFRTTVLPFFHSIEDFDKLGKLIKGAKRFTLQNFRPEITLNDKLRSERSFTNAELNEIASTLAKYVDKVSIHKNN